MKIKNSFKRLDQFWGEVDKKHIDTISNFISGRDILDIGCGYGTTTNHLIQKGYNCVGIDYDDDSINFCKQRFPDCSFQVANAEKLPFQNNSFDTIILRDSLHHFYGEADFAQVKLEIGRVAKKNTNIIFFDPNVNFILKLMRRLSKHTDEECTYETAIEIMEDLGCKINHKSFNTVYSLPLSGGYVGYNFIPNVKIVQELILKSEDMFENVLNKLKLGRYICWRYLIVGELINK